jgi:hypothetical protein
MGRHRTKAFVKLDARRKAMPVSKTTPGAFTRPGSMRRDKQA